MQEIVVSEDAIIFKNSVAAVEVDQDILANVVVWIEQEVAEVSEALKIIFHALELIIKSLFIRALVWDNDKGNANLGIRCNEALVVQHSIDKNLGHLIDTDVFSSIWVSSVSVENS